MMKRTAKRKKTKKAKHESDKEVFGTWGDRRDGDDDDADGNDETGNDAMEVRGSKKRPSAATSSKKNKKHEKEKKSKHKGRKHDDDYSADGLDLKAQVALSMMRAELAEQAAHDPAEIDSSQDRDFLIKRSSDSASPVIGSSPILRAWPPLNALAARSSLTTAFNQTSA